MSQIGKQVLRRLTPTYFRMGFKFEPRDLWVGIYWTSSPICEPAEMWGSSWWIYICVVPMLPLVISFDTNGSMDA